MRQIASLSHQSQKNTQIAAPQRATTKQAKARQTRRLGSRTGWHAGQTARCPSCSCCRSSLAHVSLSPLLAPQSGEHAGWRWRGVNPVIPALLGTPTKPLNQQDEKASRWVNSHAACITQTFGDACEIMPNICYRPQNALIDAPAHRACDIPQSHDRRRDNCTGRARQTEHEAGAVRRLA